MRLILPLSVALLALSFASVPAASAADPLPDADLPPLVGVCAGSVGVLTGPCHDEACVMVSHMVPQCVPLGMS